MLPNALSLTLLLAGTLLGSAPAFSQKTLKSEEVAQARALKAAQPGAAPAEIAAQVKIGRTDQGLIAWMRDDLRHYLAHFDGLFEVKLTRIARHEAQRTADLKARLAGVTSPEEIERLTELLKPHGFIVTYSDSKEFVQRFVGPKGKLLKTAPTADEMKKMDLPGVKTLYVDTWAVPFFNTATQTRAEAREGVRQALAVFEAVDLTKEISYLEFSRLMALFARPEFDDVRRYKLLPFPTAEEIARFGGERSDARISGDSYPAETPIVTNAQIGINPISELFGKREHLLGLISHSMEDSTADGRIFTGPADFLEHDYAHEFFNQGPTIPGTPADWAVVYADFLKRIEPETDRTRRRFKELVYYHFTHESGFRVLAPGGSAGAFEGELRVIEELIETRYHYEWILNGKPFTPKLRRLLAEAFADIGPFFRDRFLGIRCNAFNGPTPTEIQK